VILDPEEHELSAVMDRLPSPAGCRVLEIGCGDGRLTRRYASRVGSVVAIDPDAASIQAFRAAGVDSNVDVRACSFDGVDLRDRCVDAVIFSWSL
jgi:cyclopropane fatty-acyl-phospholipid synthase-like methyltransferase